MYPTLDRELWDDAVNHARYNVILMSCYQWRILSETTNKYNKTRTDQDSKHVVFARLNGGGGGGV